MPSDDNSSGSQTNQRPQVGQNSDSNFFLSGSCLGSFDESICDWPTYFERAELYFEVNSVPAAKQVKILLSVIGEKTYKLLKNLAQPDPVKDLTMAGLNTLLSNHLSPKPKITCSAVSFS